MYDSKIIKEVYSNLPEKISSIKKQFGQPLTLSEKILFAHASHKISQLPVRGKDYCMFEPDRVAMQDATAQMALLQFINSGKEHTAVPTTVHCDHLVRAESGADLDLKEAINKNREVYDFLQNTCRKFEIGFWPPGSGIIHQILLENYIFPGGLIIGTDSHTVNGGGLGMISIGVGGSDAVEVMAGESWELKMPEIIGVELVGRLSGWASAKDVILKLTGILTAKGGTNKIIEYFGAGAASISCTGKATICNMGAEVGATTSVFPYDKKMSGFLKITNRKEAAEMADEISEYLRADIEVLQSPEKFFNRVIRVNLAHLKPHINGPFTPDAARTIGTFGNIAAGYPEKASVVLVGSCTNSSYEDLTAVANILKEAQKKGLKLKSEFIVTPGSESIKELCRKNGILEIIEQAGGKIMANACGPCIGQWNRNPVNEKNSIITTFNRNFAKRNDGSPLTHAFITSPELATAIALSGKITFNPEVDFLQNDVGVNVKLSAPGKDELPATSFNEVVLSSNAGEKVGEIRVAEDSNRIQLLKPFPEFQTEDYKDMKLLVKARGKCTTDHISMAGVWLKYRGHLENISDNLLLGAKNAFYSEKGMTKNHLTQNYEKISLVAKHYKMKNINSIIVAEENYGEGSSREHAAMEPRFLGVKMVLVKSFARIHETNLKKQGVIGVTFKNKDDYEKIMEDDSFGIPDIKLIKPGADIELEISHSNGTKESILVNHTYNMKQLEWLKAGSALNVIRNQKDV
jgi:aconitate hydratase